MICNYCGKHFERKGTNAIYCSKKCYKLSQKEIVRKANEDHAYRDWYYENYHNAEHERKLNRGVNYGRIQAQETIDLIRKGKI